jgi:D-3-phosphoglycerate dehydrogenase / 2-oxoglutarate reductase
MRARTYVIDFDSTIVRFEVLEELAELALTGKSDKDSVMRQLRTINEQGMTGELPFNESLRQRLKLFGVHRELIRELVQLLHQDVTPSVVRHNAWFRSQAEHIYVISGGFEEYIVPVVSRLGIAADHVFANAFLCNASGDIVGCDETRLLSTAEGKVRQLALLQLPHPIVVIGDGHTDYEMRAAGEADAFWVFCENIRRPSVVAKADRVLLSFDEVAAEAEDVVLA